MDDMTELLQIFKEEAEALDRSYWYESGYDAESAALRALVQVIERVQSRLGNK